MAAKTKEQKITYTTMTAENAEAFHKGFDAGLKEVEKRFQSSFPNLIGADEKETEKKAEDRSPTDTRKLLCSFSVAETGDVAEAVSCAKDAFRTWGWMDYRERIKANFKTMA